MAQLNRLKITGINIGDANLISFEQYMNNIFGALDIPLNTRQNILISLNTLNRQDQYKIMNNGNISEMYQALINADTKLNGLVNPNGPLGQYFNKIKTEWDMMTSNLAKLQGMVILQKVKIEKDCDEVIKVLVNALNEKLKAVNSMLEQNIATQAGGSVDEFYPKYLKYKNKYLALKQKLNK